MRLRPERSVLIGYARQSAWGCQEGGQRDALGSGDEQDQFRIVPPGSAADGEDFATCFTEDLGGT